MTRKLVATVVIGQVLDGTTVVEFVQHEFVPLGVGVLLRAIGVAAPTTTLKFGEQEVLGIGVTHIEATLIDFGVVGTTGTDAVLIIGNSLACITHQPCHGIGLFVGVGNIM